MAVDGFLSFLKEIAGDVTAPPQENTSPARKPGAGFVVNLNRSLDGRVPLVLNLNAPHHKVSDQAGQWKASFSLITRKIANA